MDLFDSIRSLWLFTVICIAFAATILSTFYVWESAGRYSTLFKVRPILLDRFLWTCFTLFFGGPFIAAMFWLLHCSTLNPRMRRLVEGESTEFLGIMDALGNSEGPAVRPSDVRRRKRQKEHEQDPS